MTMRQAAGGSGQVDEPALEPEEQLQAETRLDRAAGPDGGAAAAIKGTSLAGPTGGTVGAMADGWLGATVDPDPEFAADGDVKIDRS